MNEDLISRSALIKHLNTTMYRDVMEEIKRFPVTMKVNADLLEYIEKGTMSSIEMVIDRQDDINA